MSDQKHHHGVTLDRTAVIEELQDRIHNGLPDTTPELVELIEKLPTQLVNAVIYESLDDDFWEVFDQTRSIAIERLKDLNIATIADYTAHSS